MPSVSRSALVPYSAQAMYELVNDIETYPQFLPWCRSAIISSRSENEICATLEMAKGALKKSFTTRNRLYKNEKIEISLLNGPFRHLQGFWRFQALDESSCKVSLHMEFEFSSRLLAITAGPIFSQISDSMVDAFCRRAEVVYG